VGLRRWRLIKGAILALGWARGAALFVVSSVMVYLHKKLGLIIDLAGKKD
jgi:hypothetical protein